MHKILSFWLSPAVVAYEVCIKSAFQKKKKGKGFGLDGERVSDARERDRLFLTGFALFFFSSFGVKVS